MAARNDLIVVVGILLCLGVSADVQVVDPNLKSGSANSDDQIPKEGYTYCKDGLPATKVATFAATLYTDDLCGKIYTAKCDSDMSTEPSYVNPCINEENDSTVAVTIIGKCDETVQPNCSSFVQLSADAYKEIADLNLSPLIRIYYGPQQTAALSGAAA